MGLCRPHCGKPPLRPVGSGQPVCKEGPQWTPERALPLERPLGTHRVLQGSPGRLTAWALCSACKACCRVS